LKRKVLRLVVAAVMVGMMLALAVPAFAKDGGADIFNVCRPLSGEEFCLHRVTTPSGNVNGEFTFTDPADDSFFHRTAHIHPGQEGAKGPVFSTPGKVHTPGAPE
jgi:hypothetical protein